MPVWGRAGSLIDLDAAGRGGLWPDEPTPDTTPALHRRVAEEAAPQVPSALHPRVEAPTKCRRVRRAPATKPTKKKTPAKASQPPADLVDAFDAITDAAAASSREGMEPAVKAAAQRAAARVVLDIFGGSDR